MRSTTKNFVIFTTFIMLERFTIEPMATAELEFVHAKYEKDMALYKRFMNYLMYFTLGLSIIFMVVHEVIPRPDDWDPKEHPNYFIYVFIFFVIFNILVGWIGYQYSLSKLWRDYEQQQKTIEKVAIIRKFQDIHGQEFLFEIDSAVKNILTVSAQDFEFYDAGDEINIEYACHSKEFFSYF